MKLITIVPVGSISAEDKLTLNAEGYLVVESDQPDKMTFKYMPPEQLTYTTCYTCGERIYMTEERLSRLKNGAMYFYCIHGHGTIFTKK